MTYTIQWLYFLLAFRQIDLLASGSHCNIFTAALTTKNQRQDVHTTIRHLAEGTTCLQEQRNVVADTADCVFKGRIVIDVRDRERGRGGGSRGRRGGGRRGWGVPWGDVLSFCFYPPICFVVSLIAVHTLPCSACLFAGLLLALICKLLAFACMCLHLFALACGCLRTLAYACFCFAIDLRMLPIACRLFFIYFFLAQLNRASVSFYSPRLVSIVCVCVRARCVRYRVCVLRTGWQKLCRYAT